MKRTWILIVMRCVRCWYLRRTIRRETKPPYQPSVRRLRSVPIVGGRAIRADNSSRGGAERYGSVISAQGDYNLATSAAAVNMTRPRRTRYRTGNWRPTPTGKCAKPGERNATPPRASADDGTGRTTRALRRAKALTPNEFDAVTAAQLAERSAAG